MTLLRAVAAAALLVTLPVWHSAAESPKTTKVKVDSIPFAWPNDDIQAVRITKQQVISLLRNIIEAKNGAGEGQWEDVESYRFVRLDGNYLYLVAVSDSSPMKWFQEIQVVRCEGNTCSSQWIHSEPPNDLNRQVVSLGGDDKHEILGWRSLESGARRARDLLYIYGMSDGKVEDESAKYPEYYRTKVLPDYANEAQRLAPNEFNTEEMLEKDRAELLFSQHDVERRVFGDRMAGLSDALQWEQANDDDIKALALDTFEKIDSPEAEAGLKRMSQSGSKFIRQSALDALARRAGKAAH